MLRFALTGWASSSFFPRNYGFDLFWRTRATLLNWVLRRAHFIEFVPRSTNLNQPNVSMASVLKGLIRKISKA